MKNNILIALKERPLDEGLSKSEIMDLFDMLDGVNVIPLEIQGESSSAMGFIEITAAESINYLYNEDSKLYKFIESILDDMNNENDTCIYKYIHDDNVSFEIYLSR